MSRIPFLMLIGGALLMNSCHTPATKSTQSPTNRLVGTWRLIEYMDFDSAGKPVYPYGLHPKGYFTYTRSGIVNLNISAENPLVFPGDSVYSKAFTLGQLLDNAVGYFGNYTIDTARSMVTHHVKGGSELTYIGTHQHRQFMFKGDTLFIGDSAFANGRRVLVREE